MNKTSPLPCIFTVGSEREIGSNHEVMRNKDFGRSNLRITVTILTTCYESVESLCLSELNGIYIILCLYSRTCILSS